MKFSGFQATNFGSAVEEIKRMLDRRSVPLTEEQIDNIEEDEFVKRKYSCTIFLGYTSNIVSCGLRETIKFLVQHKLVGFYIFEHLFVSCLSPATLRRNVLGGLYSYHRGWSRRGFDQVFSTYVSRKVQLRWQIPQRKWAQ